ncbi:MAG TPA: cache domain-containing protein [Spirochaetota bacterium]|nr:cache domain-containing protein [Spirochaetota bacterium]HPI88250.1 cache domain-containing protein [Spirochaetota bacterium]HPR47206.1 cache domain-containing protein [Spirochaetota bacterium]
MLERIIYFVLLFGIAGAFSAQGGFAGERAKAMALGDQAAVYLREHGEKELARVINENGMFRDGELYVWAMKTDLSTTSMVFAHPSKALINHDFIDMKDAKGKNFVREILELVKVRKTGWIEYMWTEPVSKKIKPKHTYIIRIDKVIILCGYYN